MWKSTLLSSSACVPTTTSACPDSMPERTSLRRAAGMAPVSSATCIPIGASMDDRVRQCCSARISVGAMSAVWKPLPAAA